MLAYTYTYTLQYGMMQVLDVEKAARDTGKDKENQHPNRNDSTNVTVTPSSTHKTVVKKRKQDKDKVLQDTTTTTPSARQHDTMTKTRRCGALGARQHDTMTKTPRPTSSTTNNALLCITKPASPPSHNV